MRVAWSLLLAVALAVACLAFGAGARASAPVVTAEFTNARGLVEGNDVRVDGAPAGTVSHLELSDNGTALVTLELHDGIDPPRADASAAIRPVDLIGDNYVALDLGHDPAPLQGEIPPSRTLNEPRLDDLLRSFGAPERTGIEAMLVEGGVALDQRGADLNQAALALRPALEATDSVLTELNSQTADLRNFVTAADRATHEAASRDDDLARMVGALDATLRATADHPEALDQALAGAPQSIEDLQRIAPRLTAVAKEALPLAESIKRSAPGLATAADRAVPFLESAGGAIERVDPIVGQATDLLAGADETLTGFDAGFKDLISVGPDYQRFLDALVPAAPSISEGFFVNFPDEAAEPGNQPFDPSADPRRHYWRGAAVFTCQSFGLPIKPGCLQDFLARGSRDHEDNGSDHHHGPASTDDQQSPGSDDGQPDAEQPPTSGGGLPIDPPDIPHTGNDGIDNTTELLGDLLDTLLGP